LASQWNAFSHGAPDSAQQLPESPAEPRIPKFAPADFLINRLMPAEFRDRDHALRSIATSVKAPSGRIC
jgi:hypothetical protein